MDRHPVAVIEALEASLADALEVLGGELWRCVDEEVADLVKRTHRVLGQTRALHLTTVADFEERGIAHTVGSLHTRGWLREYLNETPAAAGEATKQAVALSAKGQHAEVGKALAAGTVNVDQARVIVEAIDGLPAEATLEQREFGRRLLLDSAKELNANDLRKLGKSLLDAVDPDGAEPRDEELDRVRGAVYRDHGDGTHSITWRDSIENIALAKAAIGALDRPKPQQNGSADPRNGRQRRADALVQLFTEFLGRGDLPTSRGVRPHLQLTVSLDTLKGQPGAALSALATGSALTPEAVRRLACDAEITPIVLDPHGKPLSVGRTQRTWPAHIWAALVARDTGCAFPGCDAPAFLCRGHHMKYWGAPHNGETSLENGVLVCEPHHVQLHHRGWQVRLDNEGLPEFIPPAWIDSTRQPRRNRYWKLQRDLLGPPPDV